MTVKEALEQLRYEIEEEGHCSYIEDEMKVAFECMEKQMPKMPTPHKVEFDTVLIGNGYWGKGTTVYKCPNCDGYITRIYKHCFKCGQALDWSDV